ncbi:MAG: hypothetical protein NZL92_12475, partial [Gloeomargarita sp. SKYG116]|nr:hypothetical protein [Gloeomargarita sp. SKYG116]MDW8402495.1 hypothetical protein [Gloeomargarita sp. SKYGB_i_bin116]
GLNLPSVRAEYRRQSNVNEVPATYSDSIRLGRNQIVLGTRGALGAQIDNVTNTFNFDIQQTFDLKKSRTLQLGLSTVFSNRSENRDLSVLKTPFDSTGSQYVLLGNVYYSPFEIQSISSQQFSSRSITLSGTMTFANSLRINAGVSNQQSEFSTGVVLDTNRSAPVPRITRRERLVAQ